MKWRKFNFVIIMQLIKTIEKYPLTSIICLTVIITVPWLNDVIISLMEARNFITAREMLTKGNWFLTTLNEIPRYQKPPLPTWLTAFTGHLFGIANIWALRLPVVAMLVLLGIYVYQFSLEFLSKAHSFRNACITLTSFYVLAIVIEAPLDIFTHTFMLMGIFHFVRSYSSFHYKDALFAVIFIACSVLSKGPVSLYALLLPFLLAYPMVYGWKRYFLLKTSIPLLIGILLGSTWFIYVRIADPESFLKIAARETSNWSNYQTKPFYYYWSFFTQSGLWGVMSAIALFYPYMIKRVENKKAYQLSFLWTLFSLVLLSIVPEKKSRYLMPVLIPLAINTGFYIQYLIKKFAAFKARKESIPVYFNFGLLAILAIIFPLLAFVAPKEIDFPLLNLIIASGLLVPSGILLLQSLRKKNMVLVFYSTLLIYAILMCTLIPVLARNQNQNEAFAPITALKEESTKANMEIYLLDVISPEMLWDYGSSIPFVERVDSSYTFPDLDKFGLLVNDKNELIKSNAEARFQIREVATYNRNTLKQSARRHRPRNISYYYILTAKE